MKIKKNTAPILILGSRSDIALACAKAWAKKGQPLYLFARDIAEAKKDAKDLEIRFGISVTAFAFEARDVASLVKNYQKLKIKPRGVLVTYGELGDAKKDHHDPKRIASMIETNFSSTAAFLGFVSQDFLNRKMKNKSEDLFIAALSSVAGDRGRASNYLYGSTKAGLSAFLSGVRAELSRVGIPVLTVKPGFVATKMTVGLKLPGVLVSSAESAALQILKAIERKRDVLYVGFFWRWIMLVIVHLPEFVFKKLKF